MSDYLDALEKSYRDIESTYPELKIEIDHAKARTTTYVWEDLHTSKKVTEKERIVLKTEKSKSWGEKSFAGCSCKDVVEKPNVL